MRGCVAISELFIFDDEFLVGGVVHEHGTDGVSFFLYFCDCGSHFWVEGEGGDIIDDESTGLEGTFCEFSF